MNMGRAICMAFLLWAVCAHALPKLILAPYEWLPDGTSVEIWAVVEGERNSCEGWSYRWDFSLPDGVRREKVQGYVESPFGDYILDERAFSLSGIVNDGWAIFTRQIFRNEAGITPVKIQATLTLTAPDGSEAVASRVYELGCNESDTAEQAMEKRRQFAILSGLHWLQRRQRPKGGWPCEAYSFASYWGDLFDYKAIDINPDYEGIFLDDELIDVIEVNRESEYYDNYMSMVASACALWAFGNCGYGLDNRADNPFFGTVSRGVAYIGGRCSTLMLAGLQELGLDENRNGRGAALGEDKQYRGYVQPMVIASLMAVCTPNTELKLADVKCTAKELVQDAFDYLGWCLFNYGKSSWPYNYDEYGGFDLSIAGWNYLALEALPNWGISVPVGIRTEVLRLLYRNEDLAGGFGYSGPDGNKTIALTAAAIMGLSIAANVDLSKDGMHLCPQEKRAAGELYLNAMRHLPAIMKKQDAYLDTGYFQWTLIRMLQSEKISSIVLDNEVIDWRFDAVDKGGLWDRILALQMYDGHWIFRDDIFTYGYYNDELETAYMLLSLSNELVRKTSVISDLNVLARVPRTIGESILETDFSDLEFCDDEVLLSYYQAQWEQDSPITLTLDYLVPDGEAGEVPVQNGIEARYTNVLGEPESVEVGDMHVFRRGSAFALELLAPPEATLGEMVPIVVSLRLPNGEGFRMARFSSDVSQCTLEYDASVRWTMLQLFPEGAILPELAYKPTLSSEHWLVPSAIKDGGGVRLGNSQGQVLRLVCGDNQDIRALVYHISSEFSLLLEIEGGALLRQRISEADFGAAYEALRYWNTDGLEAKDYVIRAVLLSNGDAMLEESASIRLLGRDDYELQGLVKAGSDVYQLNDEATLSSTVMRIDGEGTKDSAEVTLSIASDDVSDTLGTWRIPNLGDASFWQRSFSLCPPGAGTYLVGQSVSSDDGRSWYSSTSFLVVEKNSDSPASDEEDDAGNNETDEENEDGETEQDEENELGGETEEGTDGGSDESDGGDEQATEDAGGDSQDDNDGSASEENGGGGTIDGEGDSVVTKRRRGRGGIKLSDDVSEQSEIIPEAAPVVNYIGGRTRVITVEREPALGDADEVQAGGGCAMSPAPRGKIYEIASLPGGKEVREAISPEEEEIILHEIANSATCKQYRRPYEIHSLEKLRLGGLWNIYGRDCQVFAGKASIATQYREMYVYPSRHNILEEHRRLFNSMRQDAIYCDGNLTVESGCMLKSGTYYVDGDVRFYGTAMGPISLVCSGKVILRGSGDFTPHSSNVLVLARKGVFVLGDDARYEGNLCSLESEVRILGNWLTFENGGIYGRRIGVYGSNNAFLGR